MGVMSANSLLSSSLRKQGPITTGGDCYGSRLPQCPIDTTRRMGPRVRGDDELSRSRRRRTHLSSPGLTGRPSTPRPIDSTSDVFFLPRPACGERSKPKASGEGDSPRVLLCRESPSPQPSQRELCSPRPRKRGEGAHRAETRGAPLVSSFRDAHEREPGISRRNFGIPDWSAERTVRNDGENRPC
jgi:hypothetical protein